MTENSQFGGIDPPSHKLETKLINVNGREEHEAMLREPDKMLSLGLDPVYEKMVYLGRWGSWLNGCINYTGNV
tara:strand:+ start:915 stop:1133 length:219 start_codon:yes stop_codon:yes gene_type:complete